MDDNYKVSVDFADLQGQLQQVQNMMQQTLSSGTFTAQSASNSASAFFNNVQGTATNMLPTYVPPADPSGRYMPSFHDKGAFASVMSSFGFGYDPSMSMSYGMYRERASEDLNYKTAELAGSIGGSFLGGAIGTAFGGPIGGIAGSFAGEWLGDKSVGAYRSTIGYDWSNTQTIQRYLRETSWRSLGGRLTEGEANSIASDMATIQRDPSLLGQRMNNSDVQRLIGEYTEAGAFNFVSSAQEYADKLKSLIKNHKDVMHILQVSEQEAVAAFAIAPTAGAAANIAGMAYRSGMTSSEMMQFGMQGMSAVAGTGLDMSLAFQHGMENVGYVKNMLADNKTLQPILMQLGGLNGTVATIEQIGNNWAMSQQGFLTMSAGLDPSLGMIGTIQQAIAANVTPGDYIANLGAQRRIASNMLGSEKILYATKDILQEMELYQGFMPMTEDTFAVVAGKHGYSDPQARLMFKSAYSGDIMQETVNEVSTARQRLAQSGERNWWDVQMDRASNFFGGFFGSSSSSRSMFEDFLEGDHNYVYTGKQAEEFMKTFSDRDKRYAEYQKQLSGRNFDWLTQGGVGEGARTYTANKGWNLVKALHPTSDRSEQGLRNEAMEYENNSYFANTMAADIYKAAGTSKDMATAYQTLMDEMSTDVGKARVRNRLMNTGSDSGFSSMMSGFATGGVVGGVMGALYGVAGKKQTPEDTARIDRAMQLFETEAKNNQSDVLKYIGVAGQLLSTDSFEGMKAKFLKEADRISADATASKEEKQWATEIIYGNALATTKSATNLISRGLQFSANSAIGKLSEDVTTKGMLMSASGISDLANANIDKNNYLRLSDAQRAQSVGNEVRTLMQNLQINNDPEDFGMQSAMATLQLGKTEETNTLLRNALIPSTSGWAMQVVNVNAKNEAIEKQYGVIK